ncbi:MAG: NADH-quinone oxidoreductase subunit NuoE [Desulfuromonas sp.]|nr:MAG: NADH-quinone oxidoreductase subunit NuoE [Desulfuromonas sp.]
MNAQLLTEQQLQHFRTKASAIAHPRELIIDILRAIQDNHGWVPDEGVEIAAELLGLSPLQVEEVATFYDKIYRQPVGKLVIHVCDSICCWSLGGEEVYRELQALLGVHPGETTTDGVFTLLPTCCLGMCGKAPAMTIGPHAYERVTPDEVAEILKNERQEALK